MTSLPEHIVRKMAAHDAHWNELPLMPHGIELPAADGDMSQLEELADRILATALPDAVEDFFGWWEGYRMLDFASRTGISFRMDPWPDEQIAAWHSEREQLLAEWRSEREAS